MCVCVLVCVCVCTLCVCASVCVCVCASHLNQSLLHSRPNAFAVITANRVFNVVADNSAEMHMWIAGKRFIASQYQHHNWHITPSYQQEKGLDCFSLSPPALSPKKFSVGEDDVLNTCLLKGKHMHHQ